MKSLFTVAMTIVRSLFNEINVSEETRKNCKLLF